MLTVSIEEVRRNLQTAIENERAVATLTGRGAPKGVAFFSRPDCEDAELVEFLSDSAVVRNLRRTLKEFESVPDGHLVHFYKYANTTRVRIVKPETKQ
jgi:hypothetical protein